MKSKAILVVLLSLICAVVYFGQDAEKGGRGGGRGQAGGKKALTRLDQDKVAPEIPGVVKAGTKLEIVQVDAPEDNALPRRSGQNTQTRLLTRVKADSAEFDRAGQRPLMHKRRQKQLSRRIQFA